MNAHATLSHETEIQLNPLGQFMMTLLSAPLSAEEADKYYAHLSLSTIKKEITLGLKRVAVDRHGSKREKLNPIVTLTNGVYDYAKTGDITQQKAVDQQYLISRLVAALANHDQQTTRDLFIRIHSAFTTSLLKSPRAELNGKSYADILDKSQSESLTDHDKLRLNSLPLEPLNVTEPPRKNEYSYGPRIYNNDGSYHVPWYKRAGKWMDKHFLPVLAGTAVLFSGLVWYANKRINTPPSYDNASAALWNGNSQSDVTVKRDAPDMDMTTTNVAPTPVETPAPEKTIAAPEPEFDEKPMVEDDVAVPVSAAQTPVSSEFEDAFAPAPYQQKARVSKVTYQINGEVIKVVMTPEIEAYDRARTKMVSEIYARGLSAEFAACQTSTVCQDAIAMRENVSVPDMPVALSAPRLD